VKKRVPGTGAQTFSMVIPPDPTFAAPVGIPGVSRRGSVEGQSAMFVNIKLRKKVTGLCVTPSNAIQLQSGTGLMCIAT
jgi:hypothetical protein